MLVQHSQRISETWFMCGSRMEISLGYTIGNIYHINRDMMDFDQMITLTSSLAANCFVEFPETYQGSSIRIYTDDVHTDYLILIREKDNTELQLSDMYILTSDDTSHGLAILCNLKQDILANK